MSRVNVQRTRFAKRFLVGAVLLLVGALATASAQASTIFFDGFDGSQVVSNPSPYTGTMPVSIPATWEATVYGTDAITVGGGVATFNTGTIETATMSGISTQLSGLGSSTDWTAEVRFKATGTLAAAGTRDYALLDGIRSAATLVSYGIDLRLVQDDSGVNSNTYNLGWWGYGDANRTAEIIATGLTKNEFHIATAHRKSDGNVDIYLDSNYVATKAAINAGPTNFNPLLFRIGDGSSSVAGTVTLDYVSVTAVPEPGSLALLSVGLIGLLAYAWRKRR